jgi:hypothetical protein
MTKPMLVDQCFQSIMIAAISLVMIATPLTSARADVATETVQAAIDLCLDPALSHNDRIQTLDSLGWTKLSDPEPAAEMLALANLIGANAGDPQAWAVSFEKRVAFERNYIAKYADTGAMRVHPDWSGMLLFGPPSDVKDVDLAKPQGVFCSVFSGVALPLEFPRVSLSLSKPARTIGPKANGAGVFVIHNTVGTDGDGRSWNIEIVAQNVNSDTVTNALGRDIGLRSFLRTQLSQE